MGFLNEIRSRINSVQSTRQITSAMKMIASSKHHKAQDAIERFLEYQNELLRVYGDFMEYKARERINVDVPYHNIKEEKKIAIVAVTSNMSMCGAFNENVVKKLTNVVEEYQSKHIEKITIFPIGTYISKRVRNISGIEVYESNLDDMIKNVQFDAALQLTEMLINRYGDGRYDKIELIYNHGKSRSTQLVLRETFLPFSFAMVDTLETLSATEEVNVGDEKKHDEKVYYNNFLLEPGPQKIIDELVPKLVKMKMYTMLLDSAAAEQSARMIAMQIATDNADNLLQELKMQYNKQRQQAITNELLDIVGGTLK